MSLNFPNNKKQIFDLIVTDVQNEFPQLAPALRNSEIRALIAGLAGRFDDLYTLLKLIQQQLFPDTATIDTFAKRWGLFKGLDILPATNAIGLITATGTKGTIIPEGTLYQDKNDFEYITINQDYTIQDVEQDIDSLTRNADKVTAVTNVGHNFAKNMPVEIAGADQTEYNGTFQIFDVVDQNTFVYKITTTPATPATGDITAKATMASVTVESVEPGLNKNADSGQEFTLKNPISGVDDSAYVQFTNVSGGADQETVTEYRERYLSAYSNPISNFNKEDIKRVLDEIRGITKVWVFDATPEPGDATIYFIRGNDENVFPNATEIAEAREAILKIKTVEMSEDDLHVLSPDPVDVDFTFTSLVPNSLALQSAINDSLKQLIIDESNVSENLTEDAYRSAIFRTVNPETGEFVKSFALSQPVGDVVINTGQLPRYNTPTYNIL